MTEKGIGVRVMVLNATFNNISVISWRSVLLVEETGVPGENKKKRQVIGQMSLSETCLPKMTKSVVFL